MAVRVLICDDQTVVREGLAAILGTDPEIEVVGLAGNGREALELAPETQPHVVLMDLKMPLMNGVKATEQILAHQPEVGVLPAQGYAQGRPDSGHQGGGRR
jgi:YesN/AraC family two-component response regulator